MNITKYNYHINPMISQILKNPPKLQYMAMERKVLVNIKTSGLAIWLLKKS